MRVIQIIKLTLDFTSVNTAESLRLLCSGIMYVRALPTLLRNIFGDVRQYEESISMYLEFALPFPKPYPPASLSFGKASYSIDRNSSPDASISGMNHPILLLAMHLATWYDILLAFT